MTIALILAAALLVGAAAAALIFEKLRNALASTAARHRRDRLVRDALFDLREIERQRQRLRYDLIVRNGRPRS